MPSQTRQAAASDLVTIRDLLRYALSRMAEAGVVHGHGASSALDEAAFLLLEALHLPIHDINPWLDARLLGEERERIIGLIEDRVTKRVPAAYLLKKVYIQGLPFRVDERVIVPRSFIAEILVRGSAGEEGMGLLPPPERITRVLDLCTGSACLAILAARLFPEATVDAVELSPEALEVARLNVADHGVEDRVRLLQGDLFGPVAGERYDLIIANPPYVSAAEVKAFPPEYAAEPVLAHLGGTDGMDLVRDIIAEAPAHLTAGGGLLCEIGLGRPIIEEEFADRDLTWIDTEESEGEVFWMGRAED